jgi:archaellum biogenesis ATPase FlaH
LLVAEGFATADSLYQATNLAVCIAFNAGNLKAVTDMLKIQYDKKRIVICADNDVSGIGIDKANLCGVDVVYPDIHGDFNDVMKQHGIDAVRDIVFGKIKHEGLFVSLTEMMANVTTPQWLIKGLLERGSMNLLFGESGAGKSLFAMDWAFCGAIGKDWHGHKIKAQLNTLVIMGEGLRGATFRFKALMKKYNGSTINGDRIRFSRRSINLLDAREAENICKLVEDMDFAPDIIIIDTLHRNMVGDENSSEDMAMYFKSIELLARKLNAAIITVHHSGHGDKGRSRGSSSIKAAMDAEFCVTKDGKDVVKFACTKSKDFGAGSDMNFTIKEVDLDGEMFYDVDEDKQITSVYLEYEGVTKKEKELTENQQKTIDSLIETLEINGKKDCVMDENGGYHTTVHYDEWYPFIKEVFKGAVNVSKDFGRCKNSLLKQKLIGNNGNYWWLV